jgi:hypothetical protein
MATKEELEAALEKAIGELIAVEEGREQEVLTRWALTFETMDLETGKRQVEVENAEGMYPWDVQGMLNRGIQVVEEEEAEEEEL